jgi:hypothetical protein
LSGGDRIVRGYEYSRGRYVTVDDEELKALQIESSKIIDLIQFVGRDDESIPRLSRHAVLRLSRRRAGGRGVPGDR